MKTLQKTTYGISYATPQLEDRIPNSKRNPVTSVRSPPGAGHFHAIYVMANNRGERNITLPNKKSGEYNVMRVTSKNDRPIV